MFGFGGGCVEVEDVLDNLKGMWPCIFERERERDW